MHSKTQSIPSATDNNMKLLNLPDCIYLTDNCKCRLLKIAECTGEKCSFRQNNEEHINSQHSWFCKMNSLNYEAQYKIAKTYYGGHMPWKAKVKGGKKCLT